MLRRQGRHLLDQAEFQQTVGGSSQFVMCEGFESQGEDGEVKLLARLTLAREQDALACDRSAPYWVCVA
ncbi:hypothetical protein [Actinoplanes friuliensis]|uniref:Uncharacterized protein n=1 Tax=Actinoplanes friuliensis DSM 7358 TaxID=1246995 RepID=U5VSU4_9ACTN|nr:hypothetical protein [Actinoplanes friuliensis]AGZ39939.1 hypothetical protein AFR_08250 [Actinoplanes friuliensis DSM 7358]